MADKKREEQYDDLPEPIDADPEDVAFALLNTPPKREDEWKYLRRDKRKPAEVREEG